MRSSGQQRQHQADNNITRKGGPSHVIQAAAPVTECQSQLEKEGESCDALRRPPTCKGGRACGRPKRRTPPSARSVRANLTHSGRFPLLTQRSRRKNHIVGSLVLGRTHDDAELALNGFQAVMKIDRATPRFDYGGENGRSSTEDLVVSDDGGDACLAARLDDG